MKDQALCEFLSSLGLGRYVESLSREGLDLTALRLLSDDELTALKIPSAGRKRILESIPNLAIATRTKQIERMEGEENGCVDPKNDNLGDNVDVVSNVPPLETETRTKTELRTEKKTKRRETTTEIRLGDLRFPFVFILGPS